MLKFIFSCLIALSLCLPASSMASSLDAFKGKEWLESSTNEKLAFLYGVSSIIAIEQMIAQQNGQKPSVFVEAWLEKFKNHDWISIEQMVTDWYRKNPQKSDRGVFEVIWYEFLDK